MTSAPIISVSGLRGIVGTSLTPEVAVRYVAAFAAELGPGPIVVTRDGRTTGAMLSQAITSGLSAIGRDVIDAGIAATPTTGIAVRTKNAAGGIQVSASHNPPEYNGIKLFSPAGRVIPATLGQQVLERYEKSPPAWAAWQQIGRTTNWHDPHKAHLELVLATVDVAAIRTRRFNVLLDANHGAGSRLGCQLLEALGCQVLLFGGEPDGRFAHPPEPTAENLVDIVPFVTTSQADVGFCQDPDADRLACIDELGRYIGEEYTLALCADQVLATRKGPVVTNCSTSLMTETIARSRGLAFYRSAVGEANVTAKMDEVEAVLGGEGNGGVIDPRVGYVRDSFVGMAIILEAMAKRSLKLSTWADSLPKYSIHKMKVDLSRDRLPAALAAIRAHFPDAATSELDGLRLDWPGRWLLIRGSNTEPIVRIIGEAESPQAAETLCMQAAEAMG